MYDVVIVGAGAAGLFAALQAKNSFPEARVAILEKTAVPLAKVRVSGGGRCNVTHACFDPKLLSTHYPRGGKELIGPFHRFQPLDTIEWFQQRGVELKTEADGRMFPVSDSSSTIIDCLLGEAERLGVELQLRKRIHSIAHTHSFLIDLEDKQLECKALILCTGSSKEGYLFAEKLGHTLSPPVPSLFTFTVPHFALADLSGISVNPVSIYLEDSSFTQTGALLLTHFGFSGPAILKLSAFGARYLHEKEYRFPLSIQWVLESEEILFQKLLEQKALYPDKSLSTQNPFKLAKNLWKMFVELTCPLEKKMKDLSHKDLRSLAHKLYKDSYYVEGKTTHKEEFVTCGGIPLSEVNFKTMESKKCPGLFFAGEILDVDGITGGFNFQNAWTSGYLAGSFCLSGK